MPEWLGIRTWEYKELISKSAEEAPLWDVVKALSPAWFFNYHTFSVEGGISLATAEPVRESCVTLS